VEKRKEWRRSGSLGPSRHAVAVALGEMPNSNPLVWVKLWNETPNWKGFHWSNFWNSRIWSHSRSEMPSDCAVPIHCHFTAS
jgi:hypothetical protein